MIHLSTTQKRDDDRARPEAGQPRRRRVLIALDLNGYGRGVLIGIIRHAASLGGWECRVEGWSEWSWSRGALRGWDGVIAMVRHESHRDALAASGVPAVNISANREGLWLPSVIPDGAAIGRLAADHFLQRGFRELVFCGTSVASFVAERADGFAQRVAAAGVRAHVLMPPQMAGERIAAALVELLRGLPPPVAVAAANDYQARHFAAACAEAGLAIPERIALLGCDDDELACTLTVPPLSSIALPGERIGVEAARLLARLIAGGSAPTQPLRFPPVAVIERRSTAVDAVADPELAVALRCIAARACKGARVAEIAAAVPLSRSALDKRFRSVLGTSMATQLRRLRLDHAKRLLRDGDQDLATVARAAGFANAKQLGAAFRLGLGTTPTQWRREHRRG